MARQTRMALGVLAVVTMAGLLAWTQTATAAGPMAWGRSFVVQDTMLRVPVRWTPSCDALGCADAYRVTWALAPVDNQAGATIVRDTTITAPMDTATVRMPAFGAPRTICLYVIAVRRGLASDATSGCRTLERPDAAPPRVDSLIWDSLVPPGAAAVLDSATFRLEVAEFAFRDLVQSDSTGAVSFARDSVRLRDTARVVDGLPVSTVITPSGYELQACGTVLDTAGAPVIIVPDDPSVTARQAVEYVQRCATAPRVRERAYAVIRDRLTFHVRAAVAPMPHRRAG